MPALENIRVARRGFSLIELALVLGISGLMLGFVLQSQQSAAVADCYVATKQQLNDIDGAIQRFARQKERLPLPAARNVGVEAVTYGREASGGAIDSVAGTSWGALPFQALGLAPSYASDCWGNKLTYVVTTALTTNATSGGYLDTTVQGNITVRKDATTNSGTDIAYAVISHGQDALGAVKNNYSSGAKGWCTGGATLTTQNCLANAATVASAAFNNGKDAGAAYFDDVIITSGRPQLLSVSNLYCWGTDSGGFGRLADGSLLANASHYFYTPTQAQGNIKFAKFAQVWRSSLGMPTMCGLTSDGTAYCWGSNAAGQIGDGTTTNRAVPTAVNTPIKFHSLYIFRDPGGTATRASVCGLQRNADGSLEGTAYCWGGNTDSTLGIGSSTNPVMAPTAVAGGLKFAMFAGGASHQGGSGAIRYPLCGLTLAGDAYCWGSGGRERGDGNSASVVSSPGLVLGGRKFSTIGVFPPICGITSAADAAGAGKIFCWGRDGNGNELWGSTPISNISQSNPATITTSVSHNLLVGDLFYIRDAQGMGAVNIGAITYTPAPYSNGTVLFNNNGLTIFSVQAAPPTATTVSPYAFNYAQYLNTTNYSAYTVSGRLIPISRSAPTEIAAGSGISFASFAEVGGAQNIAAVSTAGRVYSLGNNFSGVMGSGDPTTPTNITNGTILAGTTTMVNRAAHGLSAGSIVQLYDFSLQIPNGLYRVGPTTANSFELRTMDGTAVNTSAMGPFTALWYQQVPIGSCWNSAAQGSPAFCYSTPREPVGGFTTSTNGKGVVVNGWGSAMLTTSGIVKAWGANPVGDGTNTARATPVDAAGAVNFRAISRSGGNGGFCGISTASDAYCWGNNNTSGAYGNGGTATALSPTLVSGGFKYSSLISVPYPGGEAQNISCGILDDPALNCASQTVSWVESTRTCSASIPAMVNGEESLLTDSVPANIGNARATCVEGVIRTAAPICVGGPCTADGQPSGGNPTSCCNGDSDNNGICGTQAVCPAGGTINFLQSGPITPIVADSAFNSYYCGSCTGTIISSTYTGCESTGAGYSIGGCEEGCCNERTYDVTYTCN